MEFGPNDRFELMELTGLEEHEREREGTVNVGGAKCAKRTFLMLSLLFQKYLSLDMCTCTSLPIS